MATPQVASMQAVTPLQLSPHAPLRASVKLRFDLSPAQASARTRVELYGEAGDFLNGTPFLPIAPADGPESATAVGVELSLPRGVYAYKLKVDDVWTLDPGNARTRSRGGARNNVLVVGGAAEPLVFAPSLPFVFEEDSGELVVTAALRRGHGAALAVLVDEGHGERAFRMRPALEEDEHVVFRADVPASTGRVRLRFVIDGGAPFGGEDGSPFEWDRPPRQEAVAAFWRDAVVYTIFVDRFRPVADRPDWGVDPGPGRFAGGHLEGIRRSLDELRDLGVDVLYLTPIHAGASCHRYDVTDPLAVDPRLGGEAAFAALARDAHARGMRILIDFSFSHAGRGFPPYEDVIRHGRASGHAAWFQWKDEATLRHYGTRTDAPLFDTTHPEVAALAILAAQRWAQRGADGLRLDAAAEVPHALARAVRDCFRRLRPEGIVLGEVIPPHAWRWRAEGSVDVATDFGFHAVAGELLASRSLDAATAAARLDAGEITRGGPRHAALRFLSTHDHVRFATAARMAGDASRSCARAQLGLLWLLAMPGIPALLYGEEVGIATRPDDVGFEGVWTDRAPMPWPADAPGRALRE
jgi:cyclomaltodextrinase